MPEQPAYATCGNVLCTSSCRMFCVHHTEECDGGMTVYEWGIRLDDNTEEWHGGQEHVARARAREYRGRLIRRPLPEVVEDFRPQECCGQPPGSHTWACTKAKRPADNAHSRTSTEVGE